MIIRHTRVYEINTGEISPTDFIAMISRQYEYDNQEPLEPASLHQAAIVATSYFDGGDMTEYTHGDDMTEYIHEIDSNTEVMKS